MNKTINYFISFFTFLGYFIGLALIISLGFIESSRFYSLPLRIIISISMIYGILSQLSRKKITNIKILQFFGIFWTLYYISFWRTLNNPTVEFYQSPIAICAYSFIYCIIPFLFFLINNNNQTLKIYKKAIIFSGVLLSITSYFLYGKLLFNGIGRISMAKYVMGNDFETISPLSLSYASSLVIVICLFYIAYSKLSNKTKIYYWLTIILSMVPFFLGASRGSVIALIFSFLLIILFKGSIRTKFYSFLLLFVIGLVTYFSAEQIGSSVVRRILNLSEDISSGSSSVTRIELWHSAWNQFLTSPIWGDSVQSIIPPHPHNIILEVLMSVGIIGFIPFIVLVISAIKRGIVIIRKVPEHSWVFILFIQGMIQNMFSGTVYTAIFFWSGMALIFSIKFSLKDSKL